MAIHLERVEEIVRTALEAPYVNDGFPPSLQLVSLSGAGKSTLILELNSPGAHLTNDLTTTGLIDILERDKENRVKHIVIPDLNAPLSHRSSVSRLLVSNLLSLMQEGVVRIDDGRERKEVRHNPVGIITAVTAATWQKQLNHWSEVGLLRRMLPVHFRYSSAAQSEIENEIVKGYHLRFIMGTAIGGPVKKKVHVDLRHDKEVVLVAEAILRNTSVHYFRRLGKVGPVEPQAYRAGYIAQCRAMICAHAARRKRTETDKEDYEFLLGFADSTKHPGIEV